MPPEPQKELFLTDGNSLVYRAFFALPESIATSKGQPTNAIFGFASMLVKIISEYGVKPTLVVWDAGMSGRKEGYEEYKRATSAETTDLADRQVKWIQSVVPTYVKDQLRSKFGEGFFDEVVPKEMQKACQIKRVDDDSEEKLPVEDYLDWIQFAKLASMKEIRDEVKEVLSIRLDEDPHGKHFYSSWFDAINRIRRIPAHPSGRAYKDNDIAVLAVVVDHMKSNLPEHYVDGLDASVS